MFSHSINKVKLPIIQKKIVTYSTEYQLKELPIFSVHTPHIRLPSMDEIYGKPKMLFCLYYTCGIELF